jgi:hypothetical protein
MIVEYLNVVKGKISELDKKLDDATKEAEYYRRKSDEGERINNEIRERE